MNEAIEHNRQVDITIVENVSIEPVEKENGDVVIDVQER